MKSKLRFYDSMHNDNDARKIFQYAYSFGIIIHIMLIGSLFDFDNAYSRFIGELLIFLYFLMGIFISFKFKLPLFGGFALFYDVDKKDFDWSYRLVNIFIILLLLYGVYKGIEDLVNSLLRINT